MKYRLIDTPGFPVKHVSELKEGDGDVLFIGSDGRPGNSGEFSEWRFAKINNPTGLVARAFEVVQDEWTWDTAGVFGFTIYHNGRYRGQFYTQQAAAEYCDWKNGGNDGK